MKKKNKPFPKILWFILCFSISFFLFIKIIEYAPYVPFINKLTNRCVPNTLGIHEDNVYHHTLDRCSKYINSSFRDRNILKKMEYLVKISINSLGFRNKEYSAEKNENQTRIILLGDSFTYGFGLDIANTYFKILEKKLNQKYQKKIEVWNLASVSWGTVIHYLIVKNKILKYSPDLVVLMFDDSDFYDNIIYEEYGVFQNGNIVASQGTLNKFWKKRGKLINETWANKTNAKINITKMQAVALKYIQNIATILEKVRIPF